MTENWLFETVGLILSLEPEVMGATLLSLRVSGVAVFFSVMVSFPAAIALNFTKFRGKRLILNILHTLMGLPPVVGGLFIYFLLSRRGFLAPLELLFTPTAMIIVQLVLITPLITGIAYSVIEGVERSIKETSFSLGATTIQLAKTVLLECRYGLLTAVIAGFGRAVGEVGGIILVGGNIRHFTRNLTTAIVLETRRGEFEMAAALGIILLVLSFGVNIFLTWAQQKGVRR